MTTVVAVTGKGGVGKTTLAGLIVRYLLDAGREPILAVDADSNSNLDMVLGVELGDTIGGVREEMTEKIQAGALPQGMSKQDILQMQIEQALVETSRFDLLSMGRPEGPGCYCAINNMLRVFLDRLENNYRFVVIDNEAGMEHLSRRTTRSVDVMLVVSDPSMRGLETASRIRDLARDLKLGVGRTYLVVSRARDGLAPELEHRIEEVGMELAGVVPDDPEVARMDVTGEPVVNIDGGSAALAAVGAVMEKVLD